MNILVDADACPVIDQTIRLAARYGAAVTLFCDAAHELSREGADTVIVAKGLTARTLRWSTASRRGIS